MSALLRNEKDAFTRHRFQRKVPDVQVRPLRGLDPSQCHGRVSRFVSVLQDSRTGLQSHKSLLDDYSQVRQVSGNEKFECGLTSCSLWN